MTRGLPPKGYCRAAVALRKLGNINDSRLRGLVKEGKIERLVEPGEKQGFYKIDDIDKLIKEWNDEKRKSEDQALPTLFRPATPEDMPEIVALLRKIWGGDDTSAKRNAWLERNPESCFVVHSRGKVRGCIFILNITEEKMWWLLKLDRSQNFGVIDVEDVLPFETGKAANLWLLGLASNDIGLAKANRRKWGSILIRGMFRHIVNLGQRGIPVNMLAARSDTKDGIGLMRHIGFTEIEPGGGNINFIIDVKMSGLDFAMDHKDALREAQA
ncbi:MAG TPA: hypothetical protein VHV10_04950 [Ktedonobacteraceae bacterium]|jgi:hypothetical protein|nr:hypothetical protein [Ktedonobacteraceae bacterium]